MVDGKYQGKVFHSGHFVTFDGSVYNNHIPGEQTLMSTQLSSGSHQNIYNSQYLLHCPEIENKHVFTID
jgi:hypothetical protein